MYGDVHLTTRERYEEDAIEMHLARKRVRVPAEYQEELDLLALSGRRESQQVKSLEIKIMQEREFCFIENNKSEKWNKTNER